MVLTFGYNLQQIFPETEKPQYRLSESRDVYMFVPQDRGRSAGGVIGAREQHPILARKYYEMQYGHRKKVTS